MRAIGWVLGVGGLLGCASSVQATGDDAGAVITDGPLPARFDLNLRVQNLIDSTPLAGARLRVEDARGHVDELTADARGRAPLMVNRDDGPWTVTVTHRQFDVFSMVGACGPFDAPIALQYAGPYIPPDAGTEPPPLRITSTVRGLDANPSLTHSVQVITRNGYNRFPPNGNLDEVLPRPDGPLQVLAIESTPERVVNYGLSRVEMSPGEAVSLDVDLPRPPGPLENARVSTQFEPGGLRLVDLAGEMAAVVLVRPFSLRANDFPGSIALTAAPVSRLDDALAVEFGMLPAPLAPDIVEVTYRPAQRGGVTTRLTLPATRGETVVSVPAVHALELTGGTLDAVSFRVDAGNYPVRYLTIQGAEGRFHWNITLGCDDFARAHALPVLPAGVSLASLGFDTPSVFVTLSASREVGEPTIIGNVTLPRRVTLSRGVADVSTAGW